MQQKQSYDILDLIGLFMETRRIQEQRKWRWLQELGQEREKDIRIEMMEGQ
jgi:hypothetical protein